MWTLWLRRASIVVTAALLVGCASSTPPASTSPASIDRLDVYQALLRNLAGPDAPTTGTLFIRSVICAGADDLTTTDVGCADRFSPDEQRELAQRLSSFGKVTFVKDYDAIAKEASPPDGVLFLWVGPLRRHGNDVWVGGGIICGGTCGSGGTYVLVDGPQGWTVHGNAPETGSWIS